MSSMQDMIKRFRSEKPMPREARDEMRKQGKIREPWWVDNTPSGGARTVDPDDDHAGRPVSGVTGRTSASRSPVRSSLSPPRQRFVRYEDDDMDDYADVGAGGGRGAKRRVTGASHKPRTTGHDDDDHEPGVWEGRQHKPKAARADHDHGTSSIDAFLAEDLRKLESTWRPASVHRTNPHETGGQVGKEEGSWRYQDDRDAASLRYRFSPSREGNTTGRGNNYDFVSRESGSLDRQIADYLRPLSPPAASVESILRQAALRSTLGDPVRKEAGGGGGQGSAAKEAQGATWKTGKGEGPEPAKDPYGDLDKFASTLDVTQGLEQTMSRLAQSFQVDRSAILAEAALDTNAAAEAKDDVRQGVPVLPSSIAQVADDLELSLLPFNNFYRNKERVERSIEETLKKERDAEMKKLEDRVRYEARLEALDYVAMRWDEEAEDEQGSKDGCDGEMRQEALLDIEPGWAEEDGGALLAGPSGFASHAADIARQMAEVAAKVAAKVKLIQRIENGDLQLPASPTRAAPATDKPSPSPKHATTSQRPSSPKPTSSLARPASDAQQGRPASSSKEERRDATVPPMPTSPPQAKTSAPPSSVSTSEAQQPPKATTAAPSDALNVPRIAGPAKMIGDTPVPTIEQSINPPLAESNDARGGSNAGIGSTESPQRHSDGGRPTSPSGPAGGGGMPTTDSSSDGLTSASSGFSKLRRRLVGGDEKNEGRPPMWSAALPDKTGPAGGVTEDLLEQRLKRLMTAKRKKPANTRNKDNKAEEEELAQATEPEGDYGEFTLQETSKGIVSNLEISMMCMMKRLGCDPEQDSKKEKEKADSEKKAKDAEEKRAKQEAELAQWLELKGDELALILQRQHDKPQSAGMSDKGRPISPRERGADKENKKPSFAPMRRKDDGKERKDGSTSKPEASPLKQSNHEQHHTAKSPAEDTDDILDSLLESALDDVCSTRSSYRPFSPPDHWKSLYGSSASPSKGRTCERGAPWERHQAGQFKSSSLPTSPVGLRRRRGEDNSLLPMPGPAVATLYGPYGYGDPTDYAHGHRYGGRPAHNVPIAQARAQLEEYRHMRFRQRLHDDSGHHVLHSASSHPAPGAARSQSPISAVEGGGRAYTAHPISQTAAPGPVYPRSAPRPYHHSQFPTDPRLPQPHPPSTRLNHALSSPSSSVLAANGLFEARQRLEEFRAIRQQLAKVVSG